MKLHSKIFGLLCIALVSLGTVITPIHHTHTAHAASPAAYDVSQYQHDISAHQAKRLKHEVHFMILRAQYGSRRDIVFRHNARELQRYHVPYGVYDYSMYADKTQARGEAKLLYHRAPRADFYVNDSEENDAGRRYNASTQSWAREIHHVTSKPAILYSGLYFMKEHTTHRTRHLYNALWLAAYGLRPTPGFHYDLWQYTDAHYSRALKQHVDASAFPLKSHKPLRFWTRQNAERY